MRIELISFYINFLKKNYWDDKIIEYLNNIIDNKISKIDVGILAIIKVKGS